MDPVESHLFASALASLSSDLGQFFTKYTKACALSLPVGFHILQLIFFLTFFTLSSTTATTAIWHGPILLAGAGDSDQDDDSDVDVLSYEVAMVFVHLAHWLYGIPPAHALYTIFFYLLYLMDVTEHCCRVYIDDDNSDGRNDGFNTIVSPRVFTHRVCAASTRNTNSSSNKNDECSIIR